MPKAALIGVLCVLLTCPAVAGATTAEFAYTGAEQSFVVPADVTTVNVVAVGSRANGTSGAAGTATADLAVSPGSTLYVEVGGKSTSVAGFNGGGTSTMGSGGGGATDVRTIPRTDPGTLESRVVVAGGAGAGGSPAKGGDGGGLTAGGGWGLIQAPCTVSDTAGSGGTQDAGGAASSLGGTAGSFGSGGFGTQYGGGGGWYGGGGSNPFCFGAGGGSGHFGAGTSATSFSTASAVTAAGVTITYTIPVPDPPTLTGTFPASPGSSMSPRVIGDAHAGGTVAVYANSLCIGDPVASGSTASFASPGLAVSVAPNTSTSYYATVTTAGGTSMCSSSSIGYVNDSTAPRASVDAPADGASTGPQPTFSFHADEQGVTFSCSIHDGTPTFGPCSGAGTHTPSGTLLAGHHQFSVRATDAAGNVGDPTTIGFSVAPPAADPVPAGSGGAGPGTPALSSSPSVTDTRIDARPKARLVTKRARATVSFRFSATTRGASFRCKLDKAAYKQCTSPKRYRVGPGQHRFSVRAKGDQTATSFSFRVVRLH